MNEVLLAELAWPDYRDRIAGGDIVMVPVGATEQHGPHLPLGTDALLVGEITRQAAIRRGRTLVAPTLTYGARSQPGSGGGQTFPGTISLDATTLMAVVQDILRELVRHGCRRIAVINGHLENGWFLTEALDLAVREARLGGVADLRLMLIGYGAEVSAETLALMFPEGFPGNALEHAARMETSMMLHLFPARVRLDRLPLDPRGSFPSWQLFPPELVPVPPSGVLSPAQGCSAEFGRRLVDEAIAELVAALDGAFPDA